ncbi:MAG: beta-ketoacyl-ACP synthase III [Desulfuromonadaceae bacterium]|nr:beta-ketoacyl-ACP synthase III [Desulfuromonadaceae bacterium]
MEAYITDMAAFLPNEPVDNQNIEKVLGMVQQTPSRTRAIILRNNKIRERYYAIDPDSGRITHTNAQLTAEAVRRLRPHAGFSLDQIECLACGTSSPDQIMPGHGLMVHGELASAPCEVATLSGICLSGICALKYAALNVAAGITSNAVATGSELASTFMRSALFNAVTPERAAELESCPGISFDADFLRWMLSDGAGAAFVSKSASPGRLALKIEWIELLSFAGELETCMYSGAIKNDDGSITGWRSLAGDTAAALLVKQDVKLLNREIISTIVNKTLTRVVAKHSLSPGQINWFLPHYSSDYFRLPLHDRMGEIGFSIPQERWFSNLATRGNTGSASIYIMLEELFRSDRLTQGDTILCMIPESGRFSVAYMLLTVV